MHYRFWGLLDSCLAANEGILEEYPSRMPKEHSIRLGNAGVENNYCAVKMIFFIRNVRINII